MSVLLSLILSKELFENMKEEKKYNNRVNLIKLINWYICISYVNVYSNLIEIHVFEHTLKSI